MGGRRRITTCNGYITRRLFLCSTHLCRQTWHSHGHAGSVCADHLTRSIGVSVLPLRNSLDHLYHPNLLGRSTGRTLSTGQFHHAHQIFIAYYQLSAADCHQLVYGHSVTHQLCVNAI
ncbi:Uncharacterised protein [Vibrio cholerae]|uniref:Uncharacterized protein n=1 Tax=Vibrio cholerae TaxID=666 RepID=A0A656A9P9_VIBCL|nr:Uncharacterised protein [Vibrio cholerae]CSB17851.1 Uncharacterised protein [Vibrio cholerae]CSB71613.1 Uncharacterised protein [Vibrio cholerae]CSC34535.1 Uncharacterised protein [Vibrio cholerae]CSD02112.1 Uncharacterised protein [Vibrio cholerae]